MRCKFLLMGLALALPDIGAAATLEGLKECRALKTGREQCYDALVDKLVAAAAPPASARDIPGSRLDTLWPSAKEGDQETVFAQYKPTYLIVDTTHSPNSTPGSPKPENTVASHYPFDTKELKLQISFKTQIPLPASDTHSVWLGYTQQSHWQVFDSGNSRPFRTSNYEPELIYSYHFAADTPWAFRGLKARFMNLALVHQSNGEGGIYSRSWNRVYAQFGAEKVFESGDSLAILLRPWIRMHEKYANDDNPDLTKYMGYGELELRYWWNKQSSAAIIARKRSLQLDVALPVWIARNLHLQYFNGYGESLIDYNQRHQTFGIGFSLPFPDMPKTAD